MREGTELLKYRRSVLRLLIILFAATHMVTVFPVRSLAVPAPPTGLLATPVSGDKVKLDWGAVDGAAQYKVYRAVYASAYSTVATISTINYTDTGLKPATQYYYQITALASDNSESAAATISVSTLDTDSMPPSTPGGLTATAISPVSIQLNWNISTDNVAVRDYEIYYRLSTDANYSKVATISHPVNTYTHNGLVPGKLYYYYIRATDDHNNPSPNSAPVNAQALADTQKPTRPVILSAIVSGNRIDLAWSGSADNIGVTGYRLYRKTGSSAMTLVSPGPASATAYSDAGLAPDTTYIYEVAAVDTAGNESDRSLQISRTTALDNQPPPMPGNLSATLAGPTAIKLQWNAVTDNIGLSGYEIWRGLSANNFTAKLLLTNATSYTDSSLSPNTRYYYKVVAVDTSGNVSGAALIDAITSADTVKPTPPTFVAARSTVSKNKVHLTWSGAGDNIGVVSYEVYRSAGKSTNKSDQQGGKGAAERIAATGDTSYDDTNVYPNNTYQYYIVAIDRAGNKSAASITVSVTTNGDAEGPASPTDLKAVLVNDNETKLTWKAAKDVTGVNGYFVYRSIDNGSFYKAATTTNTSFSDKSLSARQTYRYYVVAYDTAGNTSDASNRETIYTSQKDQATVGYIYPAENVVIELREGLIRLDVSKEAVKKSALVTITMKSLGDYASSGFHSLGRVVDISADKNFAGFNKPVTLRIRYDAFDLLSANTDKLGMYYWDAQAKTWQRLDASINAGDRLVSAEIKGLGVYALLIDNSAPPVPVVTLPAKEQEKRVYQLKGKGEPFSRVEVSINWGRKYTFNVTDKGDFGGEMLLEQGNNVIRAQATDAAGNTGEWSKEQTLITNSPLVVLTDIERHWAGINIQKLVEAGITSGYKDKTFQPDRNITRVEFARFMAAVTGLTGEPNELKFADNNRIPDWAKESIAALVKAGVITGYADRTFQPYRAVNREEMAVMLHRAMNLKDKAATKQVTQLNFDDTYEISSWAREAVLAAVEKGIISGYWDNKFRPADYASRAEAATMVVRFMEMKKGKKG